jgi:hypothetical protein
MVHDLFPLALGLLRVTATISSPFAWLRDVEELPISLVRAAPESMDEGGAGRAVLKHRDGIIVHRVGKLGAVLGEAPDVVA